MQIKYLLQDHGVKLMTLAGAVAIAAVSFFAGKATSVGEPTAQIAQLVLSAEDRKLFTENAQAIADIKARLDNTDSLLNSVKAMYLQTQGRIDYIGTVLEKMPNEITAELLEQMSITDIDTLFNTEPETGPTEEIDRYQVIRQYSNVRSGPGKDHKILLTLEIDNNVIVVDEADGWYKIVISDGVYGYMHKSLLAPL